VKLSYKKIYWKDLGKICATIKDLVKLSCKNICWKDLLERSFENLWCEDLQTDQVK